MFRRNSNVTTRRLLALAFSVLVVAAITWRGAGSVSDLSFGKEPDLENSGRSSSPYRNAAAQAQEPRRNIEAKKIKNPEPGNAESIEAGKKLYQRFCASCHGPQGKGDGSLALAGGTPSDLTDDTWDFGSTDGEIFVAIRDGVSADMLAYKERLTEKQIWQVVNYVRSLGPKQKENK